MEVDMPLKPPKYVDTTPYFLAVRPAYRQGGRLRGQLRLCDFLLQDARIRRDELVFVDTGLREGIREGEGLRLLWGHWRSEYRSYYTSLKSRR